MRSLEKGWGLRKVKIEVETGARIHLGFYGIRPGYREYGGLGIYIDGVGYKIIVKEHEHDLVKGCQAGRVTEVINEVRAQFKTTKHYMIEVQKCIPEHVGLGSTTQLKLALYSAILRLEGIVTSLENIAVKAGVGSISGVGFYGFKYGGLIVDSGRRQGNELVGLLARYEFPENWYIAVVVPATRHRVFGEVEEKYMMTYTTINESSYCRALEIVFRRLLPAVVERNFTDFVTSVEELDKLTSNYFAAQKGRFCCKESEVVATALKEAGGEGIGQSSWGPTIYAFFETRKAAENAIKYVEEVTGNKFSFYYIGVLSARNYGARVSLS